MKKIQLCLDRASFLSKPTDYDAAQISKRIGKFPKQLYSSELRAIALDISLDGYTFCPATFKDNKRNKENFEQQQLFALDFDGGISFEAVKKRADYYELPILFAYDTFTSVNHNKFRVVFLNDVSITDRKAAEAMSRALGTIFPEADPSCYKDVSKMYYGGKAVLHNVSDDDIDNDRIPTIDIESLFRNLTRYLKTTHKVNHYKDRIARFSGETGIRLNRNGLLDVTVTDEPTEPTGASLSNQNGKNSPTAIIYSINRIAHGEIFPTKYYHVNFVDDSGTSEASVAGRPLKNHDPYRSSILNDISRSCQLFREFEAGRIKVGHLELFGIATNLIQVDSGTQRFRDILSVNARFYGESLRKWIDDLAYMKLLGYRPQGCDSFCPYKDECSHGTNILSTAKPKRGTMERLPGYKEEFVSVGDVEKNVYRAINGAYRAIIEMWYIIKAMTGAGKSFAFLKIMSENSMDRFLIAVPTNILKQEIYDKAVKLGLNVMKTPSLEEIKGKIPRKIWNHIQKLYKTGQHRSVHPYIHELLKKNDIPCLREYLKEREKLKNFSGSVITTHRYLLNMDEKRIKEFDAVIIDEDIILKSIVSNQGEITVSELEKLLELTTDSRLSKKIQKLLKLSKTQSCIKLDSFVLDDEEADGISTPFDIPSFCAAEHFYLRRASKEKKLKEDTVAFIKPIAFKNVKYIMVSATVDEKICLKFFGEDNVSFHECQKARYEGNLHQYPGKSMSRTSINNNPGIIQRLMKRFDIKRVIAFKDYGIGPLWFGNNEGSNLYEGKDMLVVGTPFHAEFLYKLVAFTMGFDFDEDAEMRYQLVTHNGYRFWFTTYDDENLRAIQFWMIASELEQAVGRARLLRNKCNVHLFSSFPLSQAQMINDFDYDQD